MGRAEAQQCRPGVIGRAHWHAAALAVTLSIAGAGCENAGQGALSGAGIGAVSGLAIGSFSGNAGKGAAIGAIAGGVGGAVVGDQNRRNREAQQQQQTAAVAASSNTVVVSPQPYYTGQPLGRLVGQWRVNGTVDAGNGQTLPASGTATGSIDKTYFVRLDIHLTDPRTGAPVEGTSMISQTGGRGIEVTNSFSTSPDVRHYRGQMDNSGNVINVSDTDHSGSGRRIVIRLNQGAGFTVDAWSGNNRTESFTFSPS